MLVRASFRRRWVRSTRQRCDVAFSKVKITAQSIGTLCNPNSLFVVLSAHVWPHLEVPSTLDTFINTSGTDKSIRIRNVSIQPSENSSPSYTIFLEHASRLIRTSFIFIKMDGGYRASSICQDVQIPAETIPDLESSEPHILRDALDGNGSYKWQTYMSRSRHPFPLRHDSCWSLSSASSLQPFTSSIARNFRPWK